MFGHLYHLARSAAHDWGHGLTVGIGLGWVAQSVDVVGKLLGVFALVVGIACSVRREVRESVDRRSRFDRRGDRRSPRPGASP